MGQVKELTSKEANLLKYHGSCTRANVVKYKLKKKSVSLPFLLLLYLFFGNCSQVGIRNKFYQSTDASKRAAFRGITETIG